MRDAAFTLYALLRLGFTEEAAAFIGWLTDRFPARRPAPKDGERGPLRVLYSIDGHDDLDEHELDHLEGYRGSRPVRVGNAAADQLQLDIYGEIIDSVYLYDKHGDGVSHDDWTNLVVILDWLREHWDQPDEGIWETRAGRQNHVFSRLMCWVAIERMIRMARRRGLPGDVAAWTETRDAIYRQIMEHGWNAETSARSCSATARRRSTRPCCSCRWSSSARRRSRGSCPRWTRSTRTLVVDTLVFRYDPEPHRTASTATRARSPCARSGTSRR